MQAKRKPLDFPVDVDAQKSFKNDNNLQRPFGPPDMPIESKRRRSALGVISPVSKLASAHAAPGQRGTEYGSHKASQAQLKNLSPKKGIFAGRSIGKPSAGLLSGFILAVFVFFNPLISLVFAFLIATTCTLAYFIMGYDAFWRQFFRPVSWYVGRFPDRAAHVHRSIDRFAMHWDLILDRFPEGSVSALYLPDVNAIAPVQTGTNTVFDLRLDGMAKAKH